MVTGGEGEGGRIGQKVLASRVVTPELREEGMRITSVERSKAKSPKLTIVQTNHK